MPSENEMQRRLREIARTENARAMTDLRDAAARHTAEMIARRQESDRRKAAERADHDARVAREVSEYFR